MRILATRIPPPIIALAIATLMVWLAKYVPHLFIEAPVKWTLVSLWVIVGIVVEVLAILAFRKVKTTLNPMTPAASQRLVVSGIYRYTRNPMYLGLTMQLMALSIYLQAPLTAIGILVFILLVTVLQILPEEKALKQIFGSHYTDYCQDVRRWV